MQTPCLVGALEEKREQGSFLFCDSLLEFIVDVRSSSQRMLSTKWGFRFHSFYPFLSVKVSLWLTHSRTHALTHARTHAFTHSRTYVHKHTPSSMHKHSHTLTHTHPHSHTLTHAHTHALNTLSNAISPSNYKIWCIWELSRDTWPPCIALAEW